MLKTMVLTWSSLENPEFCIILLIPYPGLASSSMTKEIQFPLLLPGDGKEKVYASYIMLRC